MAKQHQLRLFKQIFSPRESANKLNFVRLQYHSHSNFHYRNFSVQASPTSPSSSGNIQDSLCIHNLPPANEVSYSKLLKTTATKESTLNIEVTSALTEYLHIAPDGDWWIGSEMYAAKHLPSNYVRSIALPTNSSTTRSKDSILNSFDHTILLDYSNEDFIEMYDTGILLLQKKTT